MVIESPAIISATSKSNVADSVTPTTVDCPCVGVAIGAITVPAGVVVEPPNVDVSNANALLW